MLERLLRFKDLDQSLVIDGNGYALILDQSRQLLEANGIIVNTLAELEPEVAELVSDGARKIGLPPSSIKISVNTDISVIGF